MNVKELIELLKKYPPDMEVWYIDDFYGELKTEAREYHIRILRGKLILGYR